MVKKNDIFTVEVTDINNLGYGIGRIEGIVTFITGAVDGDVLEVRVIKVCRDYLIAKTEKIIKKSPYRIESVCGVSMRCGGCVFQNITYEHELLLKYNYVNTAIKKAGLKDVAVHNILSTGETDGYRNKVQYPVGENNIIGYYSNHSHNIIEVENCPLQSRAFDPILIAVKNFLRKNSINCVRHIYLRHGKMTGDIMICLVINQDDLPIKNLPDVKSIVLNINKAETNVILGDIYITVHGDGYITDIVGTDIIGGVKLNISAPAFYQVNHGAMELLYSKIYDIFDLHDGDKVIDLFCGIGAIGLYLAKRKNIILTGIDIIPEAIYDAKTNAEINNIPNTEFICGDADNDNINQADVIIIDPPRKGCTKSLISRICEVLPEKILYVSCNPDTLARDLLIFSGYNYNTNEIFPVDMFPRTGHVETVTLLRRKQDDSKKN
ncbi:MAG: 23S rRNA (uracil(1939)-C(5))-methyltransferase RlmD [Oscillospiraceae bacterium]|nr:23S rRNA (uracil(1939)-C(5))-methyltransferase RlmD [Oscillospiraceae bacterium]